MIKIPEVGKIVIASDLDGTLFDKRTEIPKNNLDAIERFKSAGGRFTLSTGRYGQTLRRLFPDCHKVVNAPVITCNGAYLVDIENDTVIKNITHTADWVVPTIKELYGKFGHELNIFTVIKKDNEPFGKEFEEDSACNYEYYKVVISRPQGDLNEVKEYLKKTHPEYYLINSSSHLLEIMSYDATKGICLDDIREYYKNKGEDVFIIAVGDYENDICMLEKADLAACPENASEEVKSVCSLHLCHCNDGAVCDLINKILNKEVNV